MLELASARSASGSRVVAAAPDAGIRIAWLDAARGLGILLVVAGHALGGLIDSPLGATERSYRPIFMAIYTFHMPLFFLLSGVLVGRRIGRDRAGFLRGLGPALVWPYFLWSVVQFTIIFALGNLVNRPASDYWGTILMLPWHSVSQFWFLYVLLLLHLLAAAALRPLGASGFLLLGLALKPLSAIVPLPQLFEYAGSQAPFYALGAFLGVQGLGAVVVERPPWVRAGLLPLLAVVTIVAVVAVAQRFDPHIPVARAPAAALAQLSWNQSAFPAAIAGTLAVIGLATLVRGRLAAIVCLLGRRSMPIFILHVLVVAAIRIAAIHLFHPRDGDVILAVAIICGATLPLVADGLARRFGVNRLLGFG
jgi:fucose 4-O-acetylase-like acetyltransferase